MNKNEFYSDLFHKFRKLVEDNGLLNEEVKITGRALTAEEAIGNTERKDFPIIKGKKIITSRF